MIIFLLSMLLLSCGNNYEQLEKNLELFETEDLNSVDKINEIREKVLNQIATENPQLKEECYVGIFFFGTEHEKRQKECDIKNEQIYTQANQNLDKMKEEIKNLVKTEIDFDKLNQLGSKVEKEIEELKYTNKSWWNLSIYEWKNDIAPRIDERLEKYNNLLAEIDNWKLTEKNVRINTLNDEIQIYAK